MKRRNIQVFYDKTLYTLKWLRTLVVTKDIFESYGYHVNISGYDLPFKGMERLVKPTSDISAIQKELLSKDYDIVFLAYHHSLPGLGSLPVSARGRLLEALRKRCNCLIWLDTADSTGTCLFDVIPYVDRYLKKQTYKDKTLYSHTLLGDRLYNDYYIKKYGFEVPKTQERYAVVLGEENCGKLGLSWNVGLGDYVLERRNGSIFWGKRDKLKFWSPDIPRTINCHFRGTVSDGVSGFQRKKTLETLKSCKDVVVPDYSFDVDHKEYIEELKKAQAVVSPFGYGEICIRDFESFIYGNTLIKPDMDHVDTYPNWYIKDETYISVDWDFSKMEGLLSWLKTSGGKKTCRSIAKNAQNIFIDYYNSMDRKKEFVEHMIKETETAEG